MKATTKLRSYVPNEEYKIKYAKHIERAAEFPKKIFQVYQLED